MQDTANLYTVTQAAQYIGVTSAAIYTAKKTNRLKGGQQIEGTLYFTQDELDAWQQARLGLIKPDALELVPADEIEQPVTKPHTDAIEQASLIEQPEHQADGIEQASIPAYEPKSTRYAIERSAQATPRKMPSCYRCGRQFMKTQEYTIKVFEDEQGEPLWKPVCRDGRCDPDIINMRLLYQQQLEEKKEQKQITKLVAALKEIRASIDTVIAEYEKK